MNKPNEPETLRIDEAESLIDKAISTRFITNLISNELLEELKEYNLLAPLVRKRLKRMILEKTQTKEEDEDPEDNITRDSIHRNQFKKIASDWFQHQIDKYFI